MQWPSSYERRAPKRRAPGDKEVASETKDEFTFACPGCAKRLRTKIKAVGKSLKCPKCQQTLVVPEPSRSAGPTANGVDTSTPRVADFPDLDLLALDGPAILDAPERERSATEIKSAQDERRRAKRARAAGSENPGRIQPVGHKSGASRNESPAAAEQTRSPQGVEGKAADSDIAPGSKDDGSETAESQPAESQIAETPKSPAGQSPAGQSSDAGRKSVFEEDFPDLDELRLEPLADSSIGDGSGETSSAGLAAHLPPGVELGNLDDLDRLVPDLGDANPLPPLFDEDATEESEYRVVCKTCGTAQYVAPSAKGMKIKCPDCYSLFKVPPPPKGWKPKKKKPVKTTAAEVLPSLAPEVEQPASVTREQDAERTQAILQKARQEISDEEIEALYDSDFDTAGFARKTFGFFGDLITMFQVVGYGIVFAGLFALAQFCANDTESGFGRGVLLLTVILAPLVALLFALPMFSGGLALIEAVANKQSRVREIPAFNMFDNVGELILIASAVAASLLPGIVIGSWLAGDGVGGMIVRVSGMMVSSFLLFPLLLLSMLDNNSIFQPFSAAVIRSLREAAEAWAGYYLKTLVGFFVTLVLWYMLLGGSPVTSGVAGFFLPLLWFFVCQQLGALADGIADHLSFELAGNDSDGDESSLAAE